MALAFSRFKIFTSQLLWPWFDPLNMSFYIASQPSSEHFKRLTLWYMKPKKLLSAQGERQVSVKSHAVTYCWCLKKPSINVRALRSQVYWKAVFYYWAAIAAWFRAFSKGATRACRSKQPPVGTGHTAHFSYLGVGTGWHHNSTSEPKGL